MMIPEPPSRAEDPAAEHSKPTIRICNVIKKESGSCGFHLTRTKWDPYPWIAEVDEGSLAEDAGLKVGDCVLEVNGEDVLGLRVGEIANKALSGNDHITMLVWNSGSDKNCDSDSLCCTPMPTSLSRLSSCLSSILSFLECPICLEIISPPAHQCPLGHLICFRCRVFIESCPICRTGFTRERSLFADQVYNALIEAFHLKSQTTTERTTKLWQRIFGKKKREKSRDRRTESTTKLSRATEFKNKIFNRFIGKSSSVDNLASETSTSFTPHLRKKSISTTDIYPESLKQLNYAYNSYFASTESLLSNHDNNGNGLSRYSSAAASCDALNATNRNLPYFNRLRIRNCNNANAENLFQFSTEAINNDDTSTQPDKALYRCPVSHSCVPLTSSLSLNTHLQQHCGPVIQYFEPDFTINFPFSFENESVIIVHCYENIFFTKIDVEGTGDIKLYVWIMAPKAAAKQFKVELGIRGKEHSTEMMIKTIPNSIVSDESTNECYNNQIIIPSRVYFADGHFAVDFHFTKVMK